ncbi:MAG: hypothetical protein RLZZ352_2376 [Pseudomonadota bacterium]
MSYFLKILMKAGQTLSLNLYTERTYLRPVRGAQASDMSRMLGDMRVVGSDLQRLANRELPNSRLP